MAKSIFVLGCIVVGVFGIPPLQSNKELESRIVGGSKAPEGGFPYQASIRSSKEKHTCGGFIISTTTILTAAHCVHRLSASDITVVVGSNRLDSGGFRYGVKTIKAHERYNSMTQQNDIAILKLSSDIVFSGKIQPIALETSYIEANVEALLSGWGFLSYPGSQSNDLQYIVLRTISITDCKQRLGGKIDDSHICTLTKSGEGACHGDSGGALVSNGAAIGIVSWGRPCAIGYPDVYTRVSSYSDWINKNSW